MSTGLAGQSIIFIMTTFRILPFFLAATVLFSCQNGGKAPAFDASQLIGRWELTKAWRNYRPTETLTDTYYEFLENGTMKTNLTLNSDTSEYPFRISGFDIIQKSKPDEVVFTVEDINDSLLTMSMVLRNFPFKLVLKKVEEETEPTSR
ncbi:MAG: hypothetical protein ACE5FF_11480 [Saprospiraceae bacterium]